MNKPGDVFSKFVEIIQTLRDPKSGCPWDLEQDHLSLRPYMIEEAYEVLEAIEKADDKELKKELGDVLLQVVLHAQVAKDRGSFEISDVISAISDKMVRRHPHVFGNTEVSSSTEVVQNWEEIKYHERQQASKLSGDEVPKSALSGVPKSLPALLQAQRLGDKAGRVSFDWDSAKQVWNKVKEEVSELEVEVDKLSDCKDSQPQDELREKLEHELGDVLFSLCQLARWTGLSAEDSLRVCCQRFTERFYAMEKFAERPLSELDLEEMEALWERAKE